MMGISSTHSALAPNRPAPSPRLPIKESIGTANEKLGRLLGKIENFNSHLFPIAEVAGEGCSPSPMDISDMLDQLHNLIDRCEKDLDSIRDRF